MHKSKINQTINNCELLLNVSDCTWAVKTFKHFLQPRVTSRPLTFYHKLMVAKISIKKLPYDVIFTVLTNAAPIPLAASH